jgi:nitrogen-specific signal transduction histidine kinase
MLPKVVGDRSALMQVFVNLVTNAVQAMVDIGGGQVTLKAYESDGRLGVGTTFRLTMPAIGVAPARPNAS